MKKEVTSTGAAIVKDRKILLIKRGLDERRFPDHWACAGGRPDSPEEPLKDAVRREVKEEIGLDFEPGNEFGVYEIDLG